MQGSSRLGDNVRCYCSDRWGVNNKISFPLVVTKLLTYPIYTITVCDFYFHLFACFHYMTFLSTCTCSFFFRSSALLFLLPFCLCLRSKCRFGLSNFSWTSSWYSLELALVPSSDEWPGFCKPAAGVPSYWAAVHFGQCCRQKLFPSAKPHIPGLIKKWIRKQLTKWKLQFSVVRFWPWISIYAAYEVCEGIQ